MGIDHMQHDLVVRNDVLRAQEVLEDKARREWNKKWGFHLNFNKMCIEEAEKKRYSPEEYLKISRKQKPKGPLEEDIWKAEPSPAAPQLSSGYVGWRSAPNYSLEKFGRLYISPRHTLPYEPPYRCIMLG